MNYKKKSKTITVIATLFTIMLCFLFVVTGAYATPSGKSDNANQTIEKSNGFTYVQRGYYYNSFIIEMGWNLSDSATNEYYHSEISLEDNSKITAYFDDSIKEYTKDEKAMTALAGLIFSLKNDPVQMPLIENPLIISITPIEPDNIETLAQEYFESENLTGFSAIFTVLNTTTQKEYLKEIYDNNKIAFFSSVINGMDNDLILLYADKSEQDKKVNFFTVILPYLQIENINKYAEKYYESNDIAIFSIIVPYMSDEVKQDWLVKANNDNKNTFSAVISKELSD